MLVRLLVISQTCMMLAGVGGFVLLSMLISLLLFGSLSESSILSSSLLTEAPRGRQSIGSRVEFEMTDEKINYEIRIFKKSIRIEAFQNGLPCPLNKAEDNHDNHSNRIMSRE